MKTSFSENTTVLRNRFPRCPEGYPLQTINSAYVDAGIEQIEFQKRIVKNGYACHRTDGKRGLSGWGKLAEFGAAPPTHEIIESWGEYSPHHMAFNTGIACSNVVAIDIDIDSSSDAVNRVYKLAEEHLGEEPLLRAGRLPRVTLVYRTDEPINTQHYGVTIGGVEQGLDIVANGGQFIAYGIHPDTKRPYLWRDGRSPVNTPRSHLPKISAVDLQNFLSAVNEEFDGLHERDSRGGEGGSAALVYTDGLISNGRETYLRDLTFKLVQDAPGAVTDLNEQELITEAETQFRVKALIDGRWSSQRFLDTNIRSKLRSAIKKRQKAERENADEAMANETANDNFADINASLFDKFSAPVAGNNNTAPIQPVGSADPTYDGVAWHIAGTRAEDILQCCFGINRPKAGWPDVLGWYEGKKALVLRLDHARTPSALYITFGAGVQSGQHLNDFYVERFGAEDANFAKLPGEGRLIVCEGPLPALSIWAATGRPVWMAMQHPVDLADDIPDGAILALDERPYQWNTLNEASKRKTVKGKLDALRRAGRKLVHVHPQLYRKHDDSTFADLYLFSGPEAVRDRIAFADSVADGTAQPAKARSKEEARAKLGGDMAVWCGKLKAGTAPAAMLLRSDAGAGKTEAFVRNIPATAQDLKDKHKGNNPNILIGVANHDNSSEVAERLQAANGDNIRVGIYRGREQHDPETGKPMCRDIKAVNAAAGELRSVEKEVCGPCKFRFECGYQKQLDSTADVWLVPHTNLVINSVPRCFGSIQGVVIDEDPTGGWVDAKNFTLDSLVNLDIPVGLEIGGGDKLREFRRALFEFLNSQALGPISRDGLREVFTVSRAERALWLERSRRLSDPSVNPDGLNAMIFGVKWEDNTTFKGFELLWETVLDIVSDEGGRAGRLSLVEEEVNVDGQKTPMRFIEVIKRTGIADAWLYRGEREEQVPVLFTDATPTESVLRDFHPDLIVKDTGRIETPNAKTYQDATRRYSMAMLAPNGGEAKDALWREKNRLEVGAKAYETILFRGGEGLITTNMETKEAMKAELPGLKGRFQFEHFNNVRGKDTFKHVSTQFDIGRTDPGKRVFEQDAGALTGTMPESSEGDSYAIADAIRFTPDGPIIDCNQNFNIDPLVQALHDRTVRSEGIQAQARPRPIDRTADNPVSIYAFNDTVYETEVTLLEDEWKPHPIFLSLVKYGLAVVDSPKQASVAFPDLFPSERSYRHHEEFATFGPEMVEFREKSQIIPKTGSHDVFSIYILIEETSRLRCFGIIQPGQGRKPFSVLVDPLAHDGRDPLDVIRERFGSDVAITEIKIDPTTGQPVTDLDQDAIREQVKPLMKARKVSQAALAEVIGVKQAKVSKWLKGDQDLKTDALASLLDWIGGNEADLPVDGAFDRSEEAKNAPDRIEVELPLPDNVAPLRTEEVSSNGLVEVEAANDDQPGNVVCASGTVCRRIIATARPNPPTFRATGTPVWLAPAFECDLNLNNAPVLDYFDLDLNNAPILEYEYG